MPFELTRSDLSATPADAYILDGGDALSVRRRGPFKREFDVLPAVTGPEADALTQAYLAGLEAAANRRCGVAAMELLGLRAGALPEISVRSGVRAASIFLRGHDMRIVLCVPPEAIVRFEDDFYDSLRAYILQRYSIGPSDGIFGRSLYRLNAVGAAAPAPCADAAPPEAGEKASRESLEELLRAADAGFSQQLLRLIDRSGRKDSEVYKKANIDRKLFSKIRSNPDYRPSKSTALALGLALELDLDELRDLVSRAGYSLTHSSRRDIIVEYFVSRGKYDLFEINEALFAFDEPLLGGA